MLFDTGGIVEHLVAIAQALQAMHRDRADIGDAKVAVQRGRERERCNDSVTEQQGRFESNAEYGKGKFGGERVRKDGGSGRVSVQCEARMASAVVDCKKGEEGEDGAVWVGSRVRRR